jgi:aldose 1-epimerase
VRPTIQLAAGPLRVEVVPSLGAGVARFDILRGGRRIEVFRGWPNGGTDDPNALGLYVLAPWSNRISGGGFSFGEAFYPLASNFAGEPCPIHGNAWLSPWNVFSNADRSTRLGYESDGPGPYRYEATVEYALDGGGLMTRLKVVNHAAMALPFGLGFHPWFPRTPRTLLVARAESVWLEDACHLPTKRIAVEIRPEWDFSSFRTLPSDWINSAFVGWNGGATILWEDRGLALDIEAQPPISTYILYSPSARSPFFCFEPVSHSVNAHNLPPGPEAHGLVILAPEATLAAECRFAVREFRR